MAMRKGRYQGKRLAGNARSTVPEPPQEQTAPAAEEPQIPVAPDTAPVEEPVPASKTELTAEETPVPETKTADVPAEKAEKEEEKKKGFWADYGYLIVTAAVVILVFRVLLQLAYVPTASMENTIPTNSLLVSWQLPYLVSDPQPQRDDVVTFWSDELGKLLVKRVIGLPGEEVTFSDGYVYVDGVKLDEPYLDEQGATYAKRQDSYRVPEGCLLVLGDNRDGSQDSRFWNDPYVPLKSVRARVMVCIPVNFLKIGFLPKWNGIPLPIVGEIHTVS